MKTSIYIVRHAETVGNIENRLTGRTDFKISMEGQKSIKALTNRLSNIKFDKFYASMSNRTKETIKQLAELNKKEIIQLEELCEMNFGLYDGLTWEEVNRINPSIKLRQKRINEISGIPEQETMEELAKRMQRCVCNIIKENEGNTILICSHGVAIEAFLREILQVPFNRERERFCQHNTAVNEIEFDGKKFNVIKMADISHIKYMKESSEQ